MARGMAPPTPSSTPLHSLLSPTKRHDSTQNTTPQEDPGDVGYELIGTRSADAALMDSFTNIPTVEPHGGSTFDFETMDSLSLWEWGDSAFEIDAAHCNHSASPAPMWDIPSGSDMLSSTSCGVSNNDAEPRQEPAFVSSHAPQQGVVREHQTLPESTANSSKSHSPPNADLSSLFSDLTKDVDCRCSSQLGHLMYLVSLRRTGTIPLDVVLAMERQADQTKCAISTCGKCCLSSPYMSMVLCSSISWVIEHLETYVRDATTASAQKGQDTHVTIGGLVLSKEMSHTCSEALVKLRLRRVVQTARELMTVNTETRSTLLDGVRSTATETGAAAQRMFGMLEMRGTF